MKKIPENISQLLQQYLDKQLSETQAREVENLLESNEAVRNTFDRLQIVDGFLKNQPLQEPSKNFTDSVMNRLDSYPATRSFSLRNGIFLLVGVLLLTAIASVLISLGVFDTTDSLNLNNVISTNYLKRDLPTIPFDGTLIMNVLIIINLAIAFVVLDKAVLKPWFEQRRMHT